MRLDDIRGGFRSDERTDLTEAAHRFALSSARIEARQQGLSTDAIEVASAGGALWIMMNGYVSEVRGQSSAGGHGKQGCAPERIAALRELPVPARIVFVDQTHHDTARQKWQAVWLDIDEPEVITIDGDTTHKRQGWWVKDLIRGEGFPIDFPESPPEPVGAAQGALL